MCLQSLKSPIEKICDLSYNHLKSYSPNVIAWKATCRLDLDLIWTFLFICLGYVVDGMENGSLLLKGVDFKLVLGPWYMDKSNFCLCKMHMVKIGTS
jgi:hypothetical protein